MHKVFKKIYDSRVFITASLISGFIIWRFNYNFNEFSRAVSKEKVYDLRRATEQLNLYRELYNPDKDILEVGVNSRKAGRDINVINNDEKFREYLNKSGKSFEGPNKLLSVASEEDKAKLRNALNQYQNLEDAEEIKKQIAKVKQQLELLEERKTTHQGIKLSRVMYGYEPSEEALKKIREYYRENKKSSNE